jgi:hypothetical protein
MYTPCASVGASALAMKTSLIALGMAVTVRQPGPQYRRS